MFLIIFSSSLSVYVSQPPEMNSTFQPQALHMIASANIDSIDLLSLIGS